MGHRRKTLVITTQQSICLFICTHPPSRKQTDTNIKKTNKRKSEILILLLTTFLYIYPCGVKFCAILVLIESKRRRQQNDADKAKQQRRRQQKQNKIEKARKRKMYSKYDTQD